MVRDAPAAAVAGVTDRGSVCANRHGCKARCSGLHELSDSCNRISTDEDMMYQCRTSTRQRISQGLPATLRAVAHSVITACVAFASLTMRIAPGECGFGAEDIGHVCCEQAGCGLAASGQQRSPRCAFDLAGAVCAGSLAALEAARQAWKVLNGGWTAVCSWRGSCWPWWASGEDLSLLHMQLVRNVAVDLRVVMRVRCVSVY